jgi:hypothetical protein
MIFITKVTKYEQQEINKYTLNQQQQPQQSQQQQHQF